MNGLSVEDLEKVVDVITLRITTGRKHSQGKPIEHYIYAMHLIVSALFTHNSKTRLLSL